MPPILRFGIGENDRHPGSAIPSQQQWFHQWWENFPSSENLRRVAKSFRLDRTEDGHKLLLSVGSEVNQSKVQTHKRPQLMVWRLQRFNRFTNRRILFSRWPQYRIVKQLRAIEEQK